MSKFAVGDIVEVVHVFCPENSHWLGRQLVVTAVGVPGEDDDGPFDGVETAPTVDSDAFYPWHPAQLRKINPPDWEAPRVRETELTE